MARFHSEMEWVCPKCAKHPVFGTGDASTFSFEDPTQLEKHILASHPGIDHSELGLLIDAGKRTVGIQKARCPLCKAGLATLEKGEDEEDEDLTQFSASGQEVGLVQLEEDDHIGTHIHEFALHSFPSPDEAKPARSEVSLSHSSPSTREEITFRRSQDWNELPDEQIPMYSRSDIVEIFEDIKREPLSAWMLGLIRAGHRVNDMVNRFTSIELKFRRSNEKLDLDDFAFSLNGSRSLFFQLMVFPQYPNDESQQEELFDDLDRHQEHLESMLENAMAPGPRSPYLEPQDPPLLVRRPYVEEPQAPPQLVIGSLWKEAADSLRARDRVKLDNLMKQDHLAADWSPKGQEGISLPDGHGEDSHVKGIDVILSRATRLQKEDEGATWKHVS